MSLAPTNLLQQRRRSVRMLVRRTVKAGRGDAVHLGHGPAVTGDHRVLDGAGDARVGVSGLHDGKLCCGAAAVALQAGASAQ